MQQPEVFVEQPSNHVSPTSAAPVNSPNTFAASVWTVYLICAAVALVTIFLHPNFRKAVLNRMFPIKYNHRIPCNNCKYFKNNRYLQCAIHPTKVLSQEAINCPDYLPKQNRTNCK